MNEDDLKRKCVKAIKKEKFPEFWYYCPTDKFYSGIPDIIFSVSGKFGAVELKTMKGKVSPIQEYTHQKIREANGKVAVCRTVEEFVKFIWSFYKKQEA